MSEENVGALNGKWSFLFRAQLTIGALLFPLITGWCVWATTQVYKLQADLQSFEAVGPRYTATQAQVDHLRTRQEVLAEISKNYPPQWLRDEVGSISRRLKTIEDDIGDIQKQRRR